jgi:hypothetical protein
MMAHHADRGFLDACGARGVLRVPELDEDTQLEFQLLGAHNPPVRYTINIPAGHAYYVQHVALNIPTASATHALNPVQHTVFSLVMDMVPPRAKTLREAAEEVLGY